MNELLEKWREFEREWMLAGMTLIAGEPKILKPTFYDFMHWLAYRTPTETPRE